MNIASTSTQDIPTNLRAERDALKSFVTLLETEQKTLLDGDIEQLAALANNKIQATHDLNKLSATRRENLLALGAKNEAGGTSAWLQAHAADSLTLWQDIQQLAEQAQHLNRTNGVLIQSKLRRNQQALAVLQGAAQNASGLYGPDGQPNLQTSGRTLGSV